MKGLDILKKIKPAKYKYKKENTPCDHIVGKFYYGMIAQDIDREFPYEDYPFLNKDNLGNYRVAYDQFIPILIKAVQEMSSKIDYLENELKKFNEYREK